MKLEKVLGNLNSFEKNSFLKIVDNLISGNPANIKEVEKILSDNRNDLKSADNTIIVEVFSLLENEFKEFVKSEFINTSSQLDILIDIISREGNAIIKQDWFSRLYENEISIMKGKVRRFKKDLEEGVGDISYYRKRDYKIYQACLHTSYHNDEENNLEKKITTDEQSILLTLSNNLGLSQEEIKLINYLILPIQKLEVESVINDLKSIGVIFYSKKSNTIYVADEIARILRKIRGKEVSAKFYRRVLLCLREPLINLICRSHGIDWKKPLDQKIKSIISEGISFKGILSEDIFKEDTTLTEKKKFFNDLVEKKLKISSTIRGSVLEEKIQNLINYFEEVERDEKVGISIDGYEKLVSDLSTLLPQFESQIAHEYQFQDGTLLTSEFLLDFNIKPRDILEIIKQEDLLKFCEHTGVKTRGDVVLNILEAYKDSDNLYLENYENIGLRNLNLLKENGIVIKEAEVGLKFEELTKVIFEKLSFSVNEELRKKLNTSKDKADIILDMGKNEIIIVECKSVKESGYNKFSSVSRQLKSYAKQAELNGFKVIKSLLISPDFSDEFIKECGLEYELNLSLIKASSLLKIMEGYKDSKHKKFPHNLLMRDVLILEDRVLKAIGK
ncbi:hypothetical protein [Echinicola rosea]|uniref:Restriction endonuclease type IV Mrr domain-containing protein n=1 Tax=Echinicola rosea TaxID=1807691 RepID=A0ABQ1UQV1_9BACT|nr:hypothetical protein [Echinicola rosea]GGF23108.1 hypothetical protein GCM10011339_08930 [Echinicola rosea]